MYCDYGETLFFQVGPEDTTASVDLTTEIANLGLNPGTYEVFSIAFTENGQEEKGTITDGVWSAPLPGVEVFWHVDLAFHKLGDETTCLGSIHFDLGASGQFGGGSEFAGIPGMNIGSGASDTNGGGFIGEAPYIGDEGFCDGDTPTIQLPDVITSSSEQTVTVVLDNPVLDQTGVSITNVFVDNTSIATLNNFIGPRKTIILNVSGQSGGTSIVVEVKKQNQTAAEDCTAVMVFTLGVINPDEIVCQITNSFEPIFVVPGTKSSEVDLVPFFDPFGGYETYSKSF